MNRAQLIAHPARLGAAAGNPDPPCASCSARKRAFDPRHDGENCPAAHHEQAKIEPLVAGAGGPHHSLLWHAHKVVASAPIENGKWAAFSSLIASQNVAR